MVACPGILRFQIIFKIRRRRHERLRDFRIIIGIAFDQNGFLRFQGFPDEMKVWIAAILDKLLITRTINIKHRAGNITRGRHFQ